MYRRLRRACPGPALLLLILSAACRLAAQNAAVPPPRSQPDLLQTLGVGARSVAMGEAYSAIGNDASAAFWNPGRLGFLQYSELMVDYRSVLNSSSQTNSLLGGSPINNTDVTTGKLQLGFLSGTYRMSPRESIALSNTLGGYYDNTSLSTTTTANTSLVTRQRTTVRNNFTTLAYGNKIPLGREHDVEDANGVVTTARKPAGFLSVGLGAFVVNQGFKFQSTSISSGIPNPPLNVQQDERGLGYGVNFGIAYDPLRTKSNTGLHIGLSYRTKITLSGLSSSYGQEFNTEIPERLSLGIAYDQQYANGGSLLYSAEVQYLGAANRSTAISQQDIRRAVADLHLGVEYTPFLGTSYRLPLRIGFRTNSNAAYLYTAYENIISFGLAYQSLKDGKTTFSVEPAVEVFGGSGQTQFTLTGRILF